MIKRVVKLTFEAEHIPAFIQIFEESKDRILAFDGCHHLELWHAEKPNNVLFTYSYWDNEEALNRYRHSDFFKSTWSKTKQLFSQRAEAWSVSVIR